MTPAQLKSLGLYCLWALIGAIVATGLHLAQVLSGSDDVLIRPLAATFTTSFFGALATALGTSQLTRLGSEQIAAQVKALQDQGVSRAEMVVLTQDEAATALSDASKAGVAFSPIQVQQITDELLRRRERETPAL